MMTSHAKYRQLSLFDDDCTADYGTARMRAADGSAGAETLSADGGASASDVEPAADYSLGALFERLSKSTFRSRFHLSAKDIAYIEEKGLPVIRRHAEDFVAKRLAPASIPNDGRQTPMRGHPVFLAQHATGCCCRECFAKWHHIPAGRELTVAERQYAVAVLMAWIERQIQ